MWSSINIWYGVELTPPSSGLSKWSTIGDRISVAFDDQQEGRYEIMVEICSGNEEVFDGAPYIFGQCQIFPVISSVV